MLKSLSLKGGAFCLASILLSKTMYIYYFEKNEMIWKMKGCRIYIAYKITQILVW